MSMVLHLAEAIRKEILGSPAVTPAPDSLASHACAELNHIIDGSTVIDGGIMHRMATLVGNAKVPDVKAGWATMLLSTDKKDPWAKVAAQALYANGISKQDIGLNWSVPGLKAQSIPLTMSHLIDESFTEKRLKALRQKQAERSAASKAEAEAIVSGDKIPFVFKEPARRWTKAELDRMNLPPRPPTSMRTTDRKLYDKMHYARQKILSKLVKPASPSLSGATVGALAKADQVKNDQPPMISHAQVSTEPAVVNHQPVVTPVTGLDKDTGYLVRVFGANTFARLTKVADLAGLPVTTIIRSFVVDGLLKHSR